MHQPSLPWELLPEDGPPADPHRAETQTGSEQGWRPAGRPAAIRRTSAPARPPSRTIVAAWAVYVLLLGPATANALLINAWILGAVSHHAVTIYGAWCPHVEALTTGIALCGGAVMAARLRLSGKASAWLATRQARLVVAVSAVAFTVGACDAALMAKVGGGSTRQRCVMAAATLLWFALLRPDSNLAACEPGLANAPRARRALMTGMGGNALASPLLFALIIELTVREAPTGVIERMVRAITSGSGFPANFTSAHGIAKMLLASTANAVVEEGVFAILVLLLARRGLRAGSIIAVSFALRAAMHMYYGPPGLADGAFSAINTYALLRWRSLVPLIVAHAAYDVLISWCGTFRWMPQSLWPSIFVSGAVCMGVAGLVILIDVAVRGSRPVDAGAGERPC